MPFKKLASAKKLANLGAEVVAFAPLESGSVVAAVTTDPVKVSVHPIGAGNHRVTNVSLDEAHGAALIDKKVAVVKSGDDLWALLDIQHTPKIEQVGRDIRSLHGCPKGGTALAIGWDGNGAALGLQNNEVGGRQFVLRGDVRCASLTTERCYVVVDGGGGQLREHPGGTPESGWFFMLKKWRGRCGITTGDDIARALLLGLMTRARRRARSKCGRSSRSRSRP